MLQRMRNTKVLPDANAERYCHNVCPIRAQEFADHLGDAYWKVGRFLEARYKWRQALEMGIEDKYATIIAEKMADGLE